MFQVKCHTGAVQRELGLLHGCMCSAAVVGGDYTVIYQEWKLLQQQQLGYGVNKTAKLKQYAVQVIS